MKRLTNDFVIIIPVFNNESLITKALESVFRQTYKSFGIIIRDDMSTDKTPEIIKSIIGIDGKNEFYTIYKNIEIIFIVNTKKMYGGGNTYDSVINYTGNPESIIGIVDGDDMLIDNNAMQLIYDVYKEKDMWQVWSQHQAKSLISINKTGFSESLPLDKYIYSTRKYWAVSHFRTCKSWLFFELERADLIDPLNEESFCQYCADAAFIYPITEMCGNEKSYFLEKVLYFYNDCLPSNEIHKSSDNVKNYSDFIRSKKRYKKISKKPKFTNN